MTDATLRETALDEAGLAGAAGVLRTAFPAASQLDARYLRWLYVENPCGPAIAFDAWAGGERVGHYAVVPGRTRVLGEEVRSGLTVNLGVVPEHRMRGLFRALAERVHEEAAARGVHHLLAVANRNSLHGFVHRLGFRHLGVLDARLCLGAPRLLAPGVAAGYERLWSEDELRWRLSPPHRERYGRVASPERERVFCASHLPGLPVLLLDRPRRTLGEASSGLARRRAPPAFVFLGRSRRLQLPAWRSVPIPVRLRPAPLNLTLRPLAPGARLPALADVEIGALDWDAY